MHLAVGVDEAARQVNAYSDFTASYLISKPSWQSVMPSTATSLESALRPTPEYFLGQALMIEYVTT